MMDQLKPYPIYKDSGVPWLGNVPKHWKKRKLRNILISVTSRNRPDLPLLSVVREKGVILRDVTSKDDNHNYIPDDLTNYKVVRQGQFAMNKMKAWQGSYGVSGHEGIVSPAYFVFAINGVEGNFFHSAIRSRAYIPFFTQTSDGVRIGQWDLSQARMREIPFFIPPIEEQTAVTRYLTYIDRRIRKYIRAKQKLIKLVEEQKQAIIHTAVTRGLNPHVPLKPSGIDWLGEIPAHWDMISAGAATSLMQTGPFGSQLHSYEYITDGIPVVNPSHMKNGRIEPDSDITVSVSKLEELARHQLRKGDIVAARRGELGRCALVTSVEEGWLCGTGSLLIRCKPSVFFPAYFQIVFSSQGIHDSLSLASVGATMDNLNTGMVARLRMPLPPYSEQLQIVKQVENVKRQCALAISSINKEIELVREYRTRLIADVVTGKLDVRAAAAALPLEPEENDIPEVDDDTVEDAELADAFDAPDDADDVK